MKSVTIILKTMFVALVFNMPNNLYAQEKAVCEYFRDKIELVRGSLMIEYKLTKSKDSISTENVDAMKQSINKAFSETGNYTKSKPLEIDPKKKTEKFEKFLTFINEGFKLAKEKLNNVEQFKTEIDKVLSKTVTTIPPPQKEVEKHSSQTNDSKELTSIKQDIKDIKTVIYDKSIIGFLGWMEIGVIFLLSLLTGLITYAILYSKISKLREEVEDLRNNISSFAYSQNSENRQNSNSNYNQDLNRINIALQAQREDITTLEKKLQKMGSVAQESNLGYTTQAQTQSQQYLYVSYRGVNGDKLQVSEQPTSNSIFQINPNNGDIIVMNAVDTTIYDSIINAITPYLNIITYDGKAEGTKIVTITSGKVKKLSDTEWQIVDRKLIKVGFQ